MYVLIINHILICCPPYPKMDIEQSLVKFACYIKSNFPPYWTLKVHNVYKFLKLYFLQINYCYGYQNIYDFYFLPLYELNFNF